MTPIPLFFLSVDGFLRGVNESQPHIGGGLEPNTISGLKTLYRVRTNIDLGAIDLLAMISVYVWLSNRLQSMIFSERVPAAFLI
jgi:hypothetical protein